MIQIWISSHDCNDQDDRNDLNPNLNISQQESSTLNHLKTLTLLKHVETHGFFGDPADPLWKTPHLRGADRGRTGAECGRSAGAEGGRDQLRPELGRADAAVLGAEEGREGAKGAWRRG